MKDRSSRLSCSRWMLTIFALMLVLGPLGCSRSNKTRDHFWQFWRSKATKPVQVYNPDSFVLPPPPQEIAGTEPGSSDALSIDGELPPPPTPIDVSALAEPEPLRQAPAGAISELQTVFFAFDSDELTQQALEALESNVAWLTANPSYNVQIEGHCDERGTNEYNMNLGDRRAKSVKAYLVSRGVSPETLHTISYGEERPVDPSQADEAFVMNRRVQFLIY